MSNGPFGNCKTAELHKIDRVQSYGCMVVIDKRTHTIVACSENTSPFLGAEPDKVLNAPWSQFFLPDALSSLFPAADNQDQTVCKLKDAELNQRQITICNHSVDNYCIVELEPKQEQSANLGYTDVTGFIQQIAKLNKPEECAELLMQEVSKLIGYDRLLLYRFLPGWHGEVIAEVVKPGVQGFLGLRFPASDVPANARRIYTLSQQRLIADVNAETVHLTTQTEGISLDLSWSSLRAVHPVHIQYLKNLGVEASFSVSIVCNGKLWGLLACHHLSPKIISMQTRQACEEYSRIASLHMSALLRAEVDLQRFECQKNLAEIKGALYSSGNTYKSINNKIDEIKSLVDASGVWLHCDGGDFFSGQVPDEQSISRVNTWLQQFSSDDVMATDRIADEFKDVQALVKFASGMLYLPINQTDFLLFMRQEEIETVQWAGKPQSEGEKDFSTKALTPRNSFQAWSETMRGKSIAWRSIDLEIADIIGKELRQFIEKSQLERMALKDPLTGLANRAMFERRINRALQDALEHDTRFAVYMIDLDKFKPVNDTYGHATGDAVLVEVANRLSILLRHQDVIARLGGDEFAVIQQGIQEKTDVDIVAGKIVESIHQPFNFDNNVCVEIGASIGVSVCPFDAINLNDLMESADLALYEVKNSGRNGFKQFEKEMLTHKESIQNQSIEIQRAFDEDQLFLVYQPIVDTRVNKVIGLEAFCRWQHPEDGDLPASAFIDRIFQHKLEGKLNKWVLERVFKDQQQWQRQGLPTVATSVNIHSRELQTIDLPTVCKEISEKHQMGMSWLRLDFDEGALSDHPGHSEKLINDLLSMGILCNIDHFGSGRLPLQQLSKLKVNTLKFDGNLLMAMRSEQKIEVFFTLLKSISNVISVPVVATKVESVEMLNQAAQFSINFVQGFGIEAFIRGEQFADLLATRDESGSEP